MSKYYNQKTTVDGIQFASRKEARRYSELKLLEKAGVIRELILQPKYRIEINDVHICDYVADFKYIDEAGPVVEDVKGGQVGAAWRIFRIKQKLVKAAYGIDVVVV